jgi:hypothetical protein
MNIMNVLNVSRRVPSKWSFNMPTGTLRKTFRTFITFSPSIATWLLTWERPVTVIRKDNSEVRKLFEDLLADWLESTISPAPTRTIKEAWTRKMKDLGR